jgi:hypothetical protein
MRIIEDLQELIDEMQVPYVEPDYRSTPEYAIADMAVTECYNIWMELLTNVDPGFTNKTIGVGHKKDYVSATIRGDIEDGEVTLAIEIHPNYMFIGSIIPGNTVLLQDSDIPKSLQRQGFCSKVLKHLKDNKIRYMLNGKALIHQPLNMAALNRLIDILGFDWINRPSPIQIT